MPVLRRVSEGLARKTSRRSFFGRGADLAFGALIGVAAGTLSRSGSAAASEWDGGCGPYGTCTVCNPPGSLLCYCEHCTAAGVCAKPCVINTTWYASGCWVTSGVTCCDCTCPPRPAGQGVCGCTTDWHANPQNCPKWSAP